MRSNCLSNKNYPSVNRRDASTGWTLKCADNENWLIATLDTSLHSIRAFGIAHLSISALPPIG